MKRTTTFAIATALAVVAVPLWATLLTILGFRSPFFFWVALLPVVGLFIGRSEYHHWQKWSKEIQSGRLISSGVSPQRLAVSHTLKRTVSLTLVLIGGAYLVIQLTAFLTTFETLASRTFFSIPLVEWLGTIVPLVALVLVRAEFHDWDVRRSERLL